MTLYESLLAVGPLKRIRASRTSACQAIDGRSRRRVRCFRAARPILLHPTFCKRIRRTSDTIASETRRDHFVRTIAGIPVEQVSVVSGQSQVALSFVVGMRGPVFMPVTQPGFISREIFHLPVFE